MRKKPSNKKKKRKITKKELTNQPSPNFILNPFLINLERLKKMVIKPKNQIK